MDIEWRLEEDSIYRYMKIGKEANIARVGAEFEEVKRCQSGCLSYSGVAVVATVIRSFLHRRNELWTWCICV